MTTPERLATVTGMGQGAMRRATQYLGRFSLLSKVEGAAFVFLVPPSMSDDQARDKLWHAFNFPQVLDNWVEISGATQDEQRAALVTAGVA